MIPASGAINAPCAVTCATKAAAPSTADVHSVGIERNHHLQLDEANDIVTSLLQDWLPPFLRLRSILLSCLSLLFFSPHVGNHFGIALYCITAVH